MILQNTVCEIEPDIFYLENPVARSDPLMESQ